MDKRLNILVTPKEASNLINLMPAALLRQARITATHGRIYDKRKLARLLKDKDAVILDLETIDREVLNSCPRLKVISRYGEGYDAIDIKAAKELGVRVTRTRGVASRAVARHAFALTLALTHNITFNDEDLKKGVWKKRPNHSDGSVTIGVVGFGKIGREIADIASKYGFKVVVYDEYGVKNKRYGTAKNLNELIRFSDVITLHVPLTAHTRNMISEKMLSGLKNKFLVNTSRGGLVDEKVLLRALDSAKLAGYAADVFEVEPISGASVRLARHPKAVCSPHVAAFDRDTAIEMTKRALENALNCLKKKHNKVVSYVS